MPAEKKAETKTYRVFLAAPGAKPGKGGEPPRPNRTIEMQAASKDSAKKAAERQAYDIATNLGQNPDGEGDAYEVIEVTEVK